MNETLFWEIIENSHQESKGDMEIQCEKLKKAIEELTPQAAEEFSNLFDHYMDSAFTWELWGAAYVINGGCGDDTFSDFRASLISRGKQAYEKALDNPDALADEANDVALVENNWFFEGIEYAVTDAVEMVIGELPPRKNPYPSDPAGSEWDEDEVYDLYPNLSRQFG